MQEEVFGPVATITPFEDLEKVIELANNSIYGLAASVFTKNINVAYGLCSSLDSGIIWVNSSNDCCSSIPFGGFKQSGRHSDLGTNAIMDYTRLKSIHVNY